MKLLLADDEPDIIELLQYNLKKEGYEIFTASNGLEAIEIAKKELPDIIILDIMMPLMDGVVTCQNLRSIPELKDKIIILLSARGEEYSEIAGLENGADDYIKKPVKIAVLKARIKALVNRINRTSESDEVTIGDLRVSFSERVVYKNKEAVHLPKKEFKLLTLLLSKPNKLFTRKEIFNHVWGSDQIIGARTIDVHIRKLREKIGDEYIKTIRGIGYKIESKNI
jgi:two-component system alkaline phosphatase synthesis response regulator PhoP